MERTINLTVVVELDTDDDAAWTDVEDRLVDHVDDFSGTWISFDYEDPDCTEECSQRCCGERCCCECGEREEMLSVISVSSEPSSSTVDLSPITYQPSLPPYAHP